MDLIHCQNRRGHDDPRRYKAALPLEVTLARLLEPFSEHWQNQEDAIG
jgi:hypothetical protein